MNIGEEQETFITTPEQEPVYIPMEAPAEEPVAVPA